MPHRNRYRGSPSSESNADDDWRSAGSRERAVAAIGCRRWLLRGQRVRERPYEIAGRGLEGGWKRSRLYNCTRDQVVVARGAARRGGSAPSQTENNSLLALINIENGHPHVRNGGFLPLPPPRALTLPLQPLRITSLSLFFRPATFFQPYLFAALLRPLRSLARFSPVPLLVVSFFSPRRHRRVIGFEPTSPPLCLSFRQFVFLFFFFVFFSGPTTN